MSVEDPLPAAIATAALAGPAGVGVTSAEPQPCVPAATSMSSANGRAAAAEVAQRPAESLPGLGEGNSMTTDAAPLSPMLSPQRKRRRLMASNRLSI